MVEIIIEFTVCCRAYGLRVSTSEVLDSIRHLSLINTLNEEEFKTVLKSNYAKSRREQSRFNYLYELFFHGVKPIDSENSFTHLSTTFNKIINSAEKNIVDDSLEKSLLNIELSNKDLLVSEKEGNIPKTDSVNKSLIEFMKGNPAKFLDIINNLNTMSSKQQKFFKSNMDQLSAKLEIMLAINQMRQQLNHLIGTNFDNIDQESIKIINTHFTKLLDRAYNLLTDEPRENNDNLIEIKTNLISNEELKNKPFSSLSLSETNQIMEIISIFVRKLKDQAGRRFRIKKRGKIDIKKTLRNSGRYQGVPLQIAFKDKPLNKSPLIILCDISGSVWASAKFMLNILYALQDCFKQVKSFVFVADIVDVTHYFEKKGEVRNINSVKSDDKIKSANEINQKIQSVNHGFISINEIIETILNSNIINTSEHTDYGNAFNIFKKKYINLLNHKTTIIIMGDGRSNYLNPQAHILGEIREKCKRVLWLNPEPHNSWNSGDSEIFAYKPYCHEIRTCMNLNHLSQFVRELVL